MTHAGLVVGTAGHIDHGKTSLVRALTGIDLDTLPEEKARGITIALGFTHLVLGDGRNVAFVDVPGHERLVRTMVAGATGIDAVLLCASALEGAMPQTREHVAILDLLGIRRGAVVITMADLVDAELLELAIDDVRTLVAGTFLEGAPIVPFSSVTGQGKDELLAVIATFPDTTRSTEGPFRLPVDRVFVRSGFGSVATGTTWSGSLTDGTTVTLLPEGTQARVRGIEVHGEKVDVATAGRRTALNLAGIEPDQVGRGTVVVQGEVPLASMIDVRYRHLASSPSLEEGVAVRVLHGTSERSARLHVVSEGETVEPGDEVWVQLRLDTPLPCLPGDRLVLRRPSPADTLGGGQIVDPWAPKVRRRDREKHAAELDRLVAGDRSVWLERAAEDGLTRADCTIRAIDPASGTVLGDRIVAVPVVEHLLGVLRDALGAWHQTNPLARGAPRRELRRGRLGHLGDRVFDALLDTLVTRGEVVVEGPLARLPTFVVSLDAGQQELRTAVLRAIDEGGLEGKSDRELAALGADAIPLVHLLDGEGVLAQIAGLGWVRAEALAGLERQVREWFTTNGELTPQSFKELTGLTRKGAIPLLEWLDRRKLTRRDGDKRVPGPGLSPV